MSVACSVHGRGESSDLSKTYHAHELQDVPLISVKGSLGFTQPSVLPRPLRTLSEEGVPRLLHRAGATGEVGEREALCAGQARDPAQTLLWLWGTGENEALGATSGRKDRNEAEGGLECPQSFPSSVGCPQAGPCDARQQSWEC